MIKYIGNELEIFELATRWKQYYKQFINQYLNGDVLEVGAGIGGTTANLCNGTQNSWICLEPDPTLLKTIKNKIQDDILSSICQPVCGTLDGLKQDLTFDTILYIDVLEHIFDDKNELEKAFSKLKKGGYLIILAPAHNYLFSIFDKAVGHYRRYNRKSLTKIFPKGLSIEKQYYLDSVGLFLSLTNKWLLKQSVPSVKQIKIWNKYFIPASKRLDSFIRYKFGKSILFIARKIS